MIYNHLSIATKKEPFGSFINLIYWNDFPFYFWLDFMAACAAASLAIGTLNGEHDT